MTARDKLLYDHDKQDWFTVALSSDISDLVQSMNEKELQLVASEQGSRGLRFFNEKLEYSIDEGVTWTEIQTGGDSNVTEAINVSYDNTSTNVEAVNVQDAITELDTEVVQLDERTKAYNNSQKIVFGEEYLSHFHKKIMNGEPTVITFSGDSTTAGLSLESDEYKLDVLMKLMLDKYGFEDISTVNRGFSGETVTEWLNDRLQGDLNTDPDLLVLRWGLNEYDDKEALLDSYRQGLTIIRNSLGLENLSILLMSPNSTNDSTRGRNIVDHEQLNANFRQLAVDFNCTFIDTFTLWKDSENADDWMDKYYAYETHLHPLGVMNIWIVSKIFDVVMPSALVAKYGSVGGGRDFTTNPLNIETESTGILPRNRMYQYTAQDITVADNDNLFTGSNVEDVLKELFTYADSGKKAIANAIGYPVEETDSFTDIVNKYALILSDISDAINNKGGQMVYTDPLNEVPSKILNLPLMQLTPNFTVINKVDIQAPRAYEITLNNYLSESELFTTLLEFVGDGSQDIYYELNFDNTDANDFIDNPAVIFDGSMRLSDTYTNELTLVESSPTDGYLYEDVVSFQYFNKIKSIKKVF